MDELYTKLRALNSEKDESFSKMQHLFKERDALTKQINTLQKERRDLAEANHKAHNAWYNWQKVENARKEEMYKAQRAEQDKAKKLEQIERAKEAAALPAFEVELAQVHSLVVLLQKMMDPTGGRATAASSSGASDLPVSKSNVPAARQASDAAALPKGVAVATPLKKKSDRWEEELFYAATPKGGKKKGMAAGNSPTAPASGKLKFDLSVMDQFLALKVDMVTKYEDIPMAIAALEKKRQFFLENRVGRSGVLSLQALGSL